jgi:hypothetical protein
LTRPLGLVSNRPLGPRIDLSLGALAHFDLPPAPGAPGDREPQKTRRHEDKARKSPGQCEVLLSRLANLLSAGGNNHSDDHQPGDHEANARANPKRVEHRE